MDDWMVDNGSLCILDVNLLFRSSIHQSHLPQETASHEIDGVRKEKERLTAAWTSHTFGLTAHFSFPFLFIIWCERE